MAGRRPQTLAPVIGVASGIFHAAPCRLSCLANENRALLANRRVAVVDDVAATGSSLAATLKLARSAAANIVGIAVILTEGHAWRKTLSGDAGLVQDLGHIPLFSLAGGKATPMPETL
jgi:Phosphoribosyl transferase domain